MRCLGQKKFKIAFLLNHLDAGGAERVVVTLANALSEVGHDVVIIVTKKVGSYLNDVSKNVEVIRLKGGRMLLAVFSLIPLVRRNQFDFVIAGLDQPNIALLLAQPFLKNGTKCIVTEHNHPVLSAKNVRGFVWQLTLRLKPLLYPRADHIITVNEASRQVLANFYGCDLRKITTLHNPVEIAKVQADAKGKCEHRWFGDHTVPLLVAAGRLAPAKDYSLMLRTMARINETRTTRLIIMGEGHLRAELEALRDKLGLNEVVDLPGFVNNPFALMARADLFIMSSETEGLPTVMVEALATGAPIVSTDCPSGPNEILENGKYGRLVPVGDVVALAEAILSQLDTPHDREKSISRAMAFLPMVVCSRYETLLKRLVKISG